MQRPQRSDVAKTESRILWGYMLLVFGGLAATAAVFWWFVSQC